MVILVRFLLLSLFFSQTVLAGKIKVDFEVLKSERTFEGLGDGTYHQIQTHMESSTKILVLEGAFLKFIVSLARGKFEGVSVDSSVPGLNGKKGHSNTSIKKNGDEFLFDFDSLFYHKSIPDALSLKFTSSVALKKGTWSDFVNGSPVIFEFTETGQKAINEAVIKVLETIATVEIKSYQEKVTLKNVEITSITCTGRSLLEGTIDKMIHKLPKCSVVILGDVSLR